jgi:hypothetical protein
MNLRYNPYQIFAASKTPAGLYARQKWLGQAGSRQWKTDFEKTAARLSAGQAEDGSWHPNNVETITKLFGLHLTMREASTRIDAALNWLLEKIDLQSVEMDPDSEVDVIQGKLVGLPFIHSRRDLFLIGATLFLASIFERQDDPLVLAIYRWLSLEGEKNNGL